MNEMNCYLVTFNNGTTHLCDQDEMETYFLSDSTVASIAPYTYR